MLALADRDVPFICGTASGGANACRKVCSSLWQDGLKN